LGDPKSFTGGQRPDIIATPARTATGAKGVVMTTYQST
jgi:hypothetical protein